MWGVTLFQVTKRGDSVIVLACWEERWPMPTGVKEGEGEYVEEGGVEFAVEVGRDVEDEVEGVDAPVLFGRGTARR